MSESSGERHKNGVSSFHFLRGNCIIAHSVIVIVYTGSPFQWCFPKGVVTTQTGILNQPCLVSQGNWANKSRVVTGYPMTRQHLWSDLLGNLLEITCLTEKWEQKHYTHITQTENILWHEMETSTNAYCKGIEYLAWSYIIECQPV